VAFWSRIFLNWTELNWSAKRPYKNHLIGDVFWEQLLGGVVGVGVFHAGIHTVSSTVTFNWFSCFYKQIDFHYVLSPQRPCIRENHNMVALPRPCRVDWHRVLALRPMGTSGARRDARSSRWYQDRNAMQSDGHWPPCRRNGGLYFVQEWEAVRSSEMSRIQPDFTVSHLIRRLWSFDKTTTNYVRMRMSVTLWPSAPAGLLPSKEPRAQKGLWWAWVLDVGWMRWRREDDLRRESNLHSSFAERVVQPMSWCTS